MILVALILLNVFEKRFINTYTTMVVEVTADDRIGLIDEVDKALGRIVKTIGNPSVEKNLRSKKVTIEYTIKLSTKVTIQSILEELERIEGVRAVKLT